jgi:phosphate starvation-inducible PhoH-like protein
MPPRRPKDPAGPSSRPCVAFEPKNDAQRQVVRLWPDCDVLFLLGPAGTGKTLAAVALAARDVAERRARHLTVVRPAVECGPSLGHLPGELSDKLAPYLAPFRQALGKVAFRFPPEVVRAEALGFSRGLTYEDGAVLLDEAQNASYRELKMFLTRLGRGGKLVVLGDPAQSDLSHTGRGTALDEVVARLEGRVPRLAVVRFPPGDEGQLRHPVVSAISRLL